MNDQIRIIVATLSLIANIAGGIILNFRQAHVPASLNPSIWSVDTLLYACIALGFTTALALLVAETGSSQHNRGGNS